MSDTEESTETIIRYNEAEVNNLYKSICVKLEMVRKEYDTFLNNYGSLASTFEDSAKDFNLLTESLKNLISVHEVKSNSASEVSEE